MTDLQKLELRRSEIRSRLGELMAVETRNEDESAELDKLSKEFQEKESEYRAALVLETEKAEKKETENTSEAREIRELRGKAPLQDYIMAAVEKRSLTGPMAELNSALEVKPVGNNGGVVIPFSVFVERREVSKDPEKRAFTGTGAYSGGEVQRPILQELFGPGIFDVLGVRVDSVPAGASEWHISHASLARAPATD